MTGVNVPSMTDYNALLARVEALEANSIPQPPDPTEGTDYTDKSLWEQTFNEEFLDPELDIYRYWEQSPSGRWKTFFYFGDRVLNPNGERQYYMDKWYKGDGQYQGGKAFGIDPFKIQDGVLSIEAKPSDPKMAPHYWGYPYTSGLITTEMSFWQTYGRFTASMKMPKGKGLWPAFWLLPKDRTWPPEADPLEFFGAPNSRGEGGPTMFHWGAHSTDNSKSFGEWNDAGVDLTQDFNVFAMEWDAQQMRFFINDRKVAEKATPPGFDRPMYMLVNLAVGGSWPENPDDKTKFPSYLDVDFVRAYKRKAA